MLSERTRLFLLSLGIAVVTWLYVNTVAQPAPPQASTASLRLTNVEVALSGAPAGWRVSANPSAIDIELRWPAPGVLSVRPGDVRAVADVGGLKPGVHQVTLRIQVPPGITAVQATPAAVAVTIIAP